MKKSIFRKILSIVLAISVTMLPSLAIAASLTDITDELSTVKAGELANHTIQFKTPSGVGTSTDTVIITFASGFDLANIGTTSIDIAEGDSGTCSSASYTDKTISDSGTAGSGEWGIATTTTVLTLTPPTNATTGEIDANVCMQIEIGTNATSSVTGTAQITNASAGSKNILYTGAFGDAGTSTVLILGDDQVAVSAEVPQSISFTISSSTIGFGNLYSDNDRFANDSGGSDTEVFGHQLTAGTNASSGYAITVKGATLTSGSNDIDAMSAVASSTTGGEQFGMRIGKSGGSGVVSSPYDQATSYAYAATASATDEVASASGSTASTIYSVYYVANIAANTEAGTYSTALTYVATANF